MINAFRHDARHKYGWRIYLALMIFILLAAYFYFQSFKSPYIGIVVEPLPDKGSWLIEAVDEGGLAADWRLQPGDRIVALDPSARLSLEGESIRLRKADFLSIARHGSELTDFRPASSLTSSAVLSFAMEALLLGLAVYAFRAQPESSVIRSFFILNYVLALVILSIFSPEGSLSLILLTYCAIWLPYLLLSFYLQFIFRAEVSRLQKYKRIYLLCTIATSIVITYLIVAEIEIFKWISDTLNMALLGTILLLAGVTSRNWRIFNRIERNQLFLLFAGLLLSLLPYTFLYAIPILLHEPFILPLKYALIGIVPISLLFTYILVKRSMLDMRLYFPRLIVHVLYFAAGFMLLALSVKGGLLRLYALFTVFVAITLLYQRVQLRYRRKSVVHGERLERQKRVLSAEMKERQVSRELLALIAEVVGKRLSVQDVCLIWHDGLTTHIHGTGQYKPTGWEIRKPGLMQPQEVRSWVSSYGFDRLVELKGPSDSNGPLGYIGIGYDTSAFSVEEEHELSVIAELAVRLLTANKNYSQSEDRSESAGQRIVPVDRSLLEAQEAERIRTSQFLHDRLLQNLIFISRDLEELYDTGRPDKERIALWLKCIYESQSDIRSLCDDLHPPIIDHGDLKSAIEWLIRNMKLKAQDGIEAEFVYELGPDEPGNELIKSNLFRAVRELVNNAYKHAGATRMAIHLWRDGRFIYCNVRDNGLGFDVSTVLSPAATGDKRFGLHSLYSQIRQLGGETDIYSIPGRGTSVHLMLPLETEAPAYAEQN
jgi:Signal transduction histidine kinase